ncbi:TnsA endonuclease N-terminal domain-containing protein [Bacillus firmus]|uniref:TnsA endonuclease N-terminal domain-containing protein n=1 Tax=Cytobacillus firmus TaxID=1399 RepID=UPI00158034FF|nr:TnsA endonuclease N-terminal domain-containing protein [Cytobacillus firmus]NUH86389.1 TnsA endonuclease N-terminal domain-containing protein [Cytobacillus firmus]
MTCNISLYDYNLSEETVSLIKHIQNSDPARRVQSRKGNVPGFYSSNKMGFTIQFESHTLELAAIYEKEFDPNVIEYYDQPPTFTINYMKNGRNRGHKYTADFFVIEKDWIGWEEWKKEEELVRLNKASPERYLQDENGVWRCPPAEEYAKKWGLDFRVRTSKEINWKLQNNLRFLEDYLLVENLSVSQEAGDLILTLVNNKPGIKLSELLEQQSSVYSADDIYSLLALSELYCDLGRYLITDFDKFPLYIDKVTSDLIQNINTAPSMGAYADEQLPNLFHVEMGIEIQWGISVWRIINIDEQTIWLLNNNDETSQLPIEAFENLVQSGAIKKVGGGSKPQNDKKSTHFIETLNNANEQQLLKANERFTIVKQVLEENRKPEEIVGVPDRTIRDWVSKYKSAERIWGNGYIGLIDQTSKKGNRNRKISPEGYNLLKKVIEDDYETIKQKNFQSSYNKFLSLCLEKGIDKISYKTFVIEAKKRPIYEQTRKRQGSKVAYKHEQMYLELDQTTPRHGSRPFEICHIDHTELDIELVCSVMGKKLGRPWVSFLVDAYSRRVLSFYLTFDSPSYRSCMMTLRECVRKHKRFPRMIVVDGGKEFQGTYFETLIAACGGGKKNRPGAKPKFGSVCERLFGTTNTMFIHNLMGNTKITRNVRQVTKEVNPKKHAVWTLELLYEAINEWLYDVYDKRPHQSLSQSPLEAFLEAQRKSGKRDIALINYDDAFLKLTLPSTTKGTAMLQPGQGIKINKRYYWSDSLRAYPHLERKQIPVKYDPYNLGEAYAFIDGSWITLYSQYFGVMRNMTEKQLKILTNEVRQKDKLLNQVSDITVKRIVEFLDKAENLEKYQLQLLKDKANKKIIDVINGRSNEQLSLVQSHEQKVSNSKGVKSPAAENLEIITLHESQGEASAIDNFDEDFEIYEEL